MRRPRRPDSRRREQVLAQKLEARPGIRGRAVETGSYAAALRHRASQPAANALSSNASEPGSGVEYVTTPGFEIALVSA